MAWGSTPITELRIARALTALRHSIARGDNKECPEAGESLETRDQDDIAKREKRDEFERCQSKSTKLEKPARAASSAEEYRLTIVRSYRKGFA
ncbi:hypothetical protein [Bradyrhizobium symbiodeficiens]|uniref:hypothetical protein n=1 Tax=Bradyrhizobium symbiodeficiens TaxID=1404367 RepID=UPI00140FD83A|nr:hypothetical protein [Bradyrhizobium symbiodeficiens]QIP00431.1 hypothetical protein HAU86_11670 [Bradyrhizobium symbiodeficiens]